MYVNAHVRSAFISAAAIREAHWLLKYAPGTITKHLDQIRLENPKFADLVDAEVRRRLSNAEKEEQCEPRDAVRPSDDIKPEPTDSDASSTDAPRIDDNPTGM